MSANGSQTSKPCTKCHETKPLEDFYRAPNGKHGRHSICKACVTARRPSRAKDRTAPNAAGGCAYPGCGSPPAIPSSGLCARHHAHLSACRESPLALTGGRWETGRAGVRRWVA